MSEIILKKVKLHDPIMIGGKSFRHEFTTQDNHGLSMSYNPTTFLLTIVYNRVKVYIPAPSIAVMTPDDAQPVIAEPVPQVEQTNPIAEELTRPRGKTQVRSSAQVSDPTRDPVFGKGK